VDDHADAHGAGVDLTLVDDGGPAEPLLELRDALFEQRLLVLRVVVLRVLSDIAELTSLLDPRGDLAPLDGREVLDLLLELGQPVLRDERFARLASNLVLCRWAPYWATP
jgi:hypothetical protein